MSTSQKHRQFVSEPMGEKGVKELAGIGEVLGKKLEDKNFDKVSMFLLLKCHQKMFMSYPVSILVVILNGRFSL